MQVLILVTHLLGTGHLSRALTLARAFVTKGHSVTVLSGGMPAPHLKSDGITLHQLPPVRSDGTNFTRLLTADNTLADAVYLAKRKDMILDVFNTTKPDTVITELFPFGRRILRDEFQALLTVAQNSCIILSSIRDILAPPSKPAKAAQTDRIIDQFYDGVLVHSDAATTPLDQSWPVSDMLSQKLHYTGYVAPAPAGPHPDQAGKNEIIVSAGGGSVGAALFECAVQAALLKPHLKWRMLIGGANPAPEIERLQNMATGSGLHIEPARPDFRQLLHHAACSVSMCGYNTALDLLQAGTPSVFIPFDDGGEVEQTLRAKSLAKHPSFAVVSSAKLTPKKLLDAVQSVQNAGRFKSDGLEFNGAFETVRITSELVAKP
ncbi:MAG: glycosyltransferase [Amylibacter sp.]|nr:glycosyltransferase [Amylibacter sp.]